MKSLKHIFFLFCLGYCLQGFGQKTLFEFGVRKNFESLINGKRDKEPLRWVDVNTSDTSWYREGNKLTGKGLPIGVVRSERMYQNFILQVEWRHMEKGGNSGIFVWCDAKPEEHNRLPSGVEVQMLELDWVNQHIRDGQTPPIAYVHGELFGAGKTRTTPDNPRGERSKSIENRCLGVGEWNKYTVVCVDGTIKLSVNGRFVNGIRQSSQRKGYLCLEAEGAKIEFRNLQIIELDEGFILPEHVVEQL
ncbi:MAG: 3-keto-disaccharide hydrolase [Agriterribacter sp.]